MANFITNILFCFIAKSIYSVRLSIKIICSNRMILDVFCVRIYNNKWIYAMGKTKYLRFDHSVVQLSFTCCFSDIFCQQFAGELMLYIFFQNSVLLPAVIIWIAIEDEIFLEKIKEKCFSLRRRHSNSTF